MKGLPLTKQNRSDEPENGRGCEERAVGSCKVGLKGEEKSSGVRSRLVSVEKGVAGGDRGKGIEGGEVIEPKAEIKRSSA